MKAALRVTLLAGALFGSMLWMDSTFGSTVHAQSLDKSVTMTINEQQVTFTNTIPILEGGNTMYMPVREFSEVMNYELQWGKTTEGQVQITLSNEVTSITVTAGSKTATVNGQAVTMSDQLWNYNNSTYIPFRFLIDQFNLNYTWDSALLQTLPSVNRAESKGQVSVSSQNSFSSKILNTAYSYLGVPYVWGGMSPNGFDCSGFVSYVFQKHGVGLPRTAHDMYKSLNTSVKAPEKGDLVFFSASGNRITHVGIYTGNNKYIHASSGSANSVIESSLGSAWSKKTYVGAKRING
ncbi:C40 family peptidase [Paenibacillus sp. 1001270B_150601_E10]|uniref:C40 family peptidase n=1 Tax=Paenibacillus sp. 1001270B_150601_E10 TaxID=2787079 RepID=UPI00189F61DA|nr:C40 family peptidase [Paenibacillus sp. 1001270B_150601_E10]